MTTTVLIIDDSEAVRHRIGRILQQHHIFERFLYGGDGLEGFRILRQESVDLVLCDLDMPGIDGYKFLRMVQSDPAQRAVPVIILTGHEDIDSKVKGLGAGASDYLTKVFNDLELIARVKVHLHNKLLQDELRRKNEELARIARIDGLTGVANRRYLMEQLEVEFQRCLRYGHPFALMMLDLDHFKSVNDTHGHHAGDAVLATVAQVISTTLRTHDVFGRYGGEEFAAFLPETDKEDAVGVAERCRAAVADTPVHVGETTLRVTASMGLAAVTDAKLHQLTELVRMADGALYTAKRDGRNRLVPVFP